MPLPDAGARRSRATSRATAICVAGAGPTSAGRVDGRCRRGAACLRRLAVVVLLGGPGTACTPGGASAPAPTPAAGPAVTSESAAAGRPIARDSATSATREPVVATGGDRPDSAGAPRATPPTRSGTATARSSGASASAGRKVTAGGGLDRGSGSGAASRSPRRADGVTRREGDIRVCAGGDVTLGTNIDTGWVALASRRAGVRVTALPEPAELLAPLYPLFQGADLALVNVEAAIGEGRAPRKCRAGSDACFALRQPVSAAAALRALMPAPGWVVGNVANNHSRDAGRAGFARTLRHLGDAGVLVTGADTVPTIVVVGRDTLAVLGFVASVTGPDARDVAAVRRHVRRAVATYGRVVVTVHMGAEGAGAQRTRSRDERYWGENRGNPVAIARTAVGAGAMLVIGHGPHVLRAAEWRGDALVAYSLGNLVTHGPFLNHEPLSRGAVLCATLGRDRAVRDAVLLPTMQRRAGLVGLDPAARAVTLIDSLSRLDFPRTGVRVDAEGRIGKG